MRWLVVSTTLLLVACGGGSSGPSYNEAAVTHVAASMVADKDLAPGDQAPILQLVKEACKGPGKIQAMVQNLMNRPGGDPYITSLAIQLAMAGCPTVVQQAGVSAG